jgi:hypothetical protein
MSKQRLDGGPDPEEGDENDDWSPLDDDEPGEWGTGPQFSQVPTEA